MGRKRKQGKARKAAKAKAKQEAEERANNDGQTANNEQEQSLAVQIQRMRNGDTKCMHGFDFDPFSGDNVGSKFVPAFNNSFCEAGCSGAPLQQCLVTAHNATMAMDEFAEVWSDSAKLEMAILSLLCIGTKFVLEGNYNYALRNATFARYFEQHIAVVINRTQALLRWNKIYEAHEADLHTLVKFFRKRIPCSCLDEKYDEVKNITKMGLCCNPQCKFSGGRVEYSKTMYCDGCLHVTYCSRECQKLDWSRHKSICKEDAAHIAEFEAMKQS